MKILNIVGARPNFMKVAPLHHAFLNYSGIESKIVHTGQHYDACMSDLFFAQLDLPQPDYHLGVCNGASDGGTQTQQTANILLKFEAVMTTEKPDWVLVVGDVTSTLACALVAVRMGVQVAHVEAGLRSNDRRMPEEINRILTDNLSDLLFVTEQAGLDNLKREGIAHEKIHFVGNVLIDSLVQHRRKAAGLNTIGALGLTPGQYVLMTMHRPANVDDEASLRSIVQIVEDTALHRTVLFPVHPRTHANLMRFGLMDQLTAIPNARLLEPQGYLEFLNLMEHAAIVITDSGGVQEETTYLQVPCLTFRDSTERPVTVDFGTNQLLADLNPKTVRRHVTEILSGRTIQGVVPPLWDGQTAGRIADVLTETRSGLPHVQKLFMKQLVQHFNTGETTLEDVPAPQVRPGQVLIQTRRSLVSPGTERMLVEFGRASLLAKARQQPDKVKQVLDKIQSDGLMPTLEAVFRKLGQPLPLGYCNVGTVLAVGEGVTDLRIGDRVASNGPHAEVVCVPRNLVALIPDSVSDDEATFTVVGAVGLQGVRLLNPTLGETVVVIGLGLIGLLTAELLQLNGCRVIGLDIDETKLGLARQRGIVALNSVDTDPVQAVLSLTNGIGTDGVLITASARHDELVSQAARMSRKRGRIVLIGVVGLNLSRAEFYEKELSFQVSCSYGPGRYDEVYEQQGRDYPLAFVRWTANRNFQTILQLLASGQLAVKSLITENVPFAEFKAIYGTIGQSRSVASLMHYPETVSLTYVVVLRENYYTGGIGTVGLIGAGNFTGTTLLPALEAAGANVKIIASAGGLNATLLAKKFGVAQSTTDYRQILDDPSIDLCIITTRHDTHARLTIEALRAGKHVFVEKPLAIHANELADIIDAQQTSGRMVMVGFNRRFSPHGQKAKALLGGLRSGEVPMNIVVTVNAGAIPISSWVHDRAVGGGRILGEACHFVDLITLLTGSRVVSVCMNATGRSPTETTDSASLLLRYQNGATGVVNYFANGSKAYAKERVEVYSQGRTLVLDNFRKLTGYGFRGFSSLSGRQNKGHTEQMKQLVEQVRNGREAGSSEPLIPFADIVNTTQTMLAALNSLRESRWVDVASIGVSHRETVVAEAV